MERGFCRRQGKDQPAVADIDELEAEHVAKKHPVRVRIGGVDQDMNAIHHGPAVYRSVL